MNAWMGFWTGVLIFGIAIFAVLAVVVGIGALFDIRDLFRGIREQHGETIDPDDAPDPEA
ncbi:MAG TPA: hypothetical protein VMZ92_18020 [Planctomycetota bacterium]|nr:hypothetical protein [Planctomycetota bacterium]